MKIAIVEDDVQASQTLQQLLNTYAEKHDLSLEISLFNDGIQIVDHYQNDFDVIYFDIQMPIMNGMTAAQKIRALDDKVVIVFLTNYVQWAIQGYSVNAADFLLKPVSAFNFNEHFKKIVAKFSQQQKTITISGNGKLRKVFVDNIFYIESEGHYLHYHLADEVISSLDSLKNIETTLKTAHFFRCNYGLLVNLAHVDQITGNEAQVGQFQVQISRPRKKAFMAALTKYLGNEVV